MPGPQRKRGRPRRRLNARLKRYAVVCEICGELIDKTLSFPHPLSFSADHKVPIARGGAEYDPRNLRPTHLICNQRRGTGDRATAAAQVPVSRKW